MMRLALLSLLAVAVSAQNNRVFTGTMLPLDSSGVTGTVTVFIASGDTVAYAGWARGLETNLESGDCTAVNGEYSVLPNVFISTKLTNVTREFHFLVFSLSTATTTHTHRLRCAHSRRYRVYGRLDTRRPLL